MDRVRRIAVATALAVSAVLAPPGAAAAASEIGVEDDFFSPKRSALTVGDSDVKWIWDLDGSSGGTTENPHDVVSRDELFSSKLVSSGTYERRASAGAFDYFCTIHAGMTGELRVKPRIAVSKKTVKVRWAGRGSNTGDRFDVQVKRGRGGHWEDLQRDGKAGSASIVPAGPRERSSLRIRARSQRGRDSDRQSRWSPAVRIDRP